MSRAFVFILLVTLMPTLAPAQGRLTYGPPSSSCAQLLKKRKVLDELPKALLAYSSAMRLKLDLVWVTRRLSLNDFVAVQSMARLQKLVLLLGDIMAVEDLVVGRMQVHGSSDQLLHFISTLPRNKGVWGWTDLVRIDSEKRLYLSDREIEARLQALRFAIVTYTTSGGTQSDGLLIVRIRDDGYLSPRLQYIFEHKDLPLDDMGSAKSFHEAANMWAGGFASRVRIGGEEYLFADPELLDMARSVHVDQLRPKNKRILWTTWLARRLGT
ncbi:MAG: hypothetical protein KF799_13740 [Bdellovibrionales bacterium]|nr:hypothetical protein [Bdellovibrionales bacterium]